MSSAQESKLSFFILIPFVALVFAFAMHSGAPKTPQMPGVLLPTAPVVVAPVAAVKPVESDAAVAPAAATAPAEPPAAPAENWE